MAGKLAVAVIMYLVADMDTNEKREMRPKTLISTYLFLYIS